MNPLFPTLSEDVSGLSADELQAYIDEQADRAEHVAANPTEFIGDDLTPAQFMEGLAAGVASIDAARAALKALQPDEAETAETETVVEELDADAVAELAARARGEAAEAEAETDPEDEPELEVTPEAEAAAEITVRVTPDLTDFSDAIANATSEGVDRGLSAAAENVRPTRRTRPARSREAEPVAEQRRIAMIAAAENLGVPLGGEIPTGRKLAEMMIARRRLFGNIPEGTFGDRIPLARAEWSADYGDERTLTKDEPGRNMDKIDAVLASIRATFEERIEEHGEDSLAASGGLCAPVTPYYGLQNLSQAERPVRGSLPSFNADRGGINAGRPAALTAIDDAVGIISEAEDAAGGTNATKTCQVIECPDFEETDVAAIYHCLQTGNMPARTFPELIEHWTNLTMAAHARVAETALLNGIGAASTHVTASALGLGASATLPSQIITAANGMRSRHRMTRDAVLRVQLPYWVLDLLVSDVYRSQFQRFEMTPEQFVALLRRHNVEPSFYVDSETGLGQVFPAQTAAALVNFPDTVVWYLYPEGSFLYLDGGTLELGLVRDSVLNATNDFQFFGETFENVAYIGVEALRVITTVCDSGTVSLPDAVACPIDY